MVVAVSFNKRIPPGSTGRGTLQALMERQKEAALMREKAMQPQQINDPLQGVAQIANVISSGVREGRAQREEQSSRQGLAELMSQVGPEGATAEQIAQMSIVDPDLASTYRKEALEARDREDRQRQEMDVLGKTQTFTAGENAANRTLTRDEGAAGRTLTREEGAAGRELTASEGEAGRTVTREEGAATRQNQLDASDLERKWKEVQPGSPGAQVLTDYQNGKYGPIGSPDAMSKRDIEFNNVTTKGAATQIIMPGETPDMWKEFDKKVGGNFADYLEEGAVAGSQIHALEIIDQINPNDQGPLVGRLAQMFPGVSSQAALFESIVKNYAPKERAEGSGSTSDIEYAGMLASWPDLKNHPEANAMISAAIKARANVALQRADIVRNMRTKKLTLEEGYQALSDLDRKSILTPELSNMIAASQAGRPAAEAPAADAASDPLVEKYRTKKAVR